MRCLVTGGAGFIGSHIVDKLVELGHQVVVIDNETSTVHDHFYYNSVVKYYAMDIADPETRFIYDGIDVVFHCAAESRIQPTIMNPLGAVRTNVFGTGTVLQFAREACVQKVVYSSTSSAYGLKNEPPCVETMIEDCLNPYSVTKVSGEKLCKLYADLYGVKTTILRYFNVYGPREPLRGQYAPVVGLFLNKHRNGEPLTIVPDGHQRRDFTHVYDVVEANILAMTIEQEQYGEIFNVGSGTNYSVLELANLISNNTVYVEPRIGEARETLANIDKISSVLGWVPRHNIADYITEQLKV